VIPNTDDIVRSYLDAMLWAEMDDTDTPLEDTFSVQDVGEQVRSAALADVRRFLAYPGVEDALREVPLASDGSDLVGHLLYLTQAHHGTGFWDRDLGEPGEILTEAARSLGERYWTVGDDGSLWVS